ncbi:peptidoglycan DD-metalloendopeptidase family protein [Labilibacter marinus]|uniref:peptidoglycan DD-metalloendopeptidase family protein n=1 Tax=Labilibacter marinus TaxID=1477105 RepID=UPI00082E88C6|nr:peptidoglycan DD-metalloendopeptidase family protein [Labilibacter marinus]
MEAIITYIIKSTLVSGVFLGLYHLSLKRESFFALNRFYLLLSLIFAYLFPLINIEIAGKPDSTVYIIQDFQSTINQFNFAETNTTQQVVSNSSSFILQYWWFLLLISVSSLLLFRFLKHLIQLQKTIYANEKIKHSKFTLVLFNQTITFSFFRYIFISPNVWRSSESNSIVNHELSHLRHKHSLDRLFVELLQIAFWMNPFIFMYRKALEEVHEFQADSDATKRIGNTNDYFNLVLQQSAQQKYSPLMSPFSYKLIKKRIKMAHYKSNPLKRLFIIAPIGLAMAIILVSTTIKQVNTIKDEVQSLTWPSDDRSTNVLISDVSSESKAYELVTENSLDKEGNIMPILINLKGVILANGNKTSINQIEKHVLSFYQSSDKTKQELPLLGTQQVSNAYIFLKKDINTPAEAANQLLLEVGNSIDKLREDGASKHFNKSYKDCNTQQQESIKQLIPMRIIVSPSKNIKPNNTKQQTFIMPIKKEELKRISAHYNKSIVNPITKKQFTHNGVDFVADLNTAVRALGDATVRTVSDKPESYGRYIILDHSDGYSSLYAHLNDFKVIEGQTIKKGDIIGLVGNTGLSTGPHLHLEVKKDGNHIDPEKVINL